MPHRVPSHRVDLPGRSLVGSLYERLPSRKADIRFYQSPAWRALRQQKLASDPLCEDCQRRGRITAATEVHHVVERKREPELALEMSNLESCCVACHNAKRGRLGG